MSLTYTRVLTDEEIQILEHDIADVTKWINDAIDGRLNYTKKRIVKSEIGMVDVNDPNASIPTTVSGLIARRFARPDYKPRKLRDNDEFTLKPDVRANDNAQH